MNPSQFRILETKIHSHKKLLAAVEDVLIEGNFTSFQALRECSDIAAEISYMEALYEKHNKGMGPYL